MSQAAKTPASFPLSTLIHSIIGLAVMFIGPMLPSPQFAFPVTEKLTKMGFPVVDGNAIISLSEPGWVAAIVFLGLLYLWVFVDTFWPSLVGFLAVAMSPHYQAGQAMMQLMGHPTTFMLFFLFFLIAALMKSNSVGYIANAILTHKSIQGKPWRLLLAMMLGTYFASFITFTATLFFVWTIVYFIADEVGLKPGDKLVTFMVGNIVIAGTLATSTDIIKGPALFMSAGYNRFVAANPDAGLLPIDVLAWIILLFVVSMCVIFLTIFAMRYIIRVDINPLLNFDIEKLKANPLPPMNWKQKTILGLIGAYAIFMLLPSILPASLPLTAYLKSKSILGSMIIFALMIVIRHKGEPLVKVNELVSAIPWPLFFLLTAVFYFGAILVNPSTNIPILMESILGSALQGLDYIPFLLVSLVLAFIMTNLMNSIVIGNILAPIIAVVAVSYGFDVMPIVVCFFIVLLSAILTPAAGVPGAFLYGNKEWLPGASARYYAVFISTIMVIVTAFVAVPLSMLLF